MQEHLKSRVKNLWMRSKWHLILFAGFTFCFRWVPGIKGIAYDNSTGEPVPYVIVELYVWTYPLISDGPGAHELGVVARTTANKRGEFSLPGQILWAPWGLHSRAYAFSHWKYAGMSVPGKYLNQKTTLRLAYRLDPRIEYYSDYCAREFSDTMRKGRLLYFDTKHLRLLKQRKIPINKTEIAKEWTEWCREFKSACDERGYSLALQELEGL
jgi:hypothetical protein